MNLKLQIIVQKFRKEISLQLNSTNGRANNTDQKQYTGGNLSYLYLC